MNALYKNYTTCAWNRLQPWRYNSLQRESERSSVGDPDPQNPHVFGLPGSISQRYGSGSGSESFPFLINVLSGLKQCLQNKNLTQNISQTSNFLVWRWCACGQVIFFCILKVKEERSRIRSRGGSISQRYGSGSAPKCHGSPTLERSIVYVVFVLHLPF